MGLRSLGVCRDLNQILETLNRCQRELAALLPLLIRHNTSTTRGRSMHCEHTIHNQRQLIIFRSLFTAVFVIRTWHRCHINHMPCQSLTLFRGHTFRAERLLQIITINFHTKCLLRITGGLIL